MTSNNEPLPDITLEQDTTMHPTTMHNSHAEDKKDMERQAAEKKLTLNMPDPLADAVTAPSIGAFHSQGFHGFLDALPTAQWHHTPHLQDILEQKISSAFYGEWYHNMAVLFGTAVLCFLIGKLRLGLGAVLILCTLLGVYYQLSTRRYRRNERDNLQRELAKMKIEADEEPLEWMNGFLAKFWLVFEPALCALVLENMDAVIGAYLPKFVASVRLTTLTLGTKPFRIESVKTYLNTEPDTVCMDWRVSFIPNDLDDLTPSERDRRVNPKVVLNIDLAKPFPKVTLPVLVEDISFRAHMRVKIRFMTKFPYAKVFEACLLDKPQFDYNLRPFGTDHLGFDVSLIPGLQGFVRDQAHAILGPMLYSPNVFTFDVEQFFADQFDLSEANGILVATIYECTPLYNVNEGDGPFATNPKDTLNSYFRFTVDGVHELGRTSVCENTFEPFWQGYHYFMLNSLNAQLCISLNNTKSGNEDEIIATAYFDLRELENDSHNGMSLPLLHKGKPIGSVRMKLNYLPVSKPVKNQDGTVKPAAESNAGVLRLMVHGCSDLVGPPRLMPYVRIFVNGSEMIKTSSAWNETNPNYETPGETIILDKSEVFIRAEVKHRHKLHDDEIIGVWTSNLVEMLAKQETNDAWWRLTLDGKEMGNIQLSATWKPVPMDSLNDELGRRGYEASPIGVMRVTFWEARDLRNVEGVTGGKSDPYVRIKSDTQVRAQTSVVDNNLSPEWGETCYVPIHSTKENLVFEVMDWNAKTPDISLGIVELQTRDLVQLSVGNQSERPDKWYTSTGVKIDQWAQLRDKDKRLMKGGLRFSVEFLPILALPQPREPPAEENPDTATTATVEDAVWEEPPIYDLHGSPVRYTPDNMVDLASYTSGVLRITIHQVRMSRSHHAFCQVVADSVTPQYKTADAIGQTLTFEETTDVFVKEADIARVAIEIKPSNHSEKDEDDNIGYWMDYTKTIIRQLVRKRRRERDGEKQQEAEEGEWFPIIGHGDDAAAIRLSFDFIPMSHFILNPDESIDNQGNLTVTLVRGNNLMAADKSGTSDPYVVFYVNGEKKHKSAVIKKTLNPVWDKEQFSCIIPSRVTASFRIEAFDWNKIQGDNHIGSGGVTLRGDMVESFTVHTVDIPLDGVAGVSGTITVRFLWQPQLIAKRRTPATVLGTTRLMTSSTISSGPAPSLGPKATRSNTSLGFSDATHSRTVSETGSLMHMSRTSLDTSSTNSLDRDDPLSQRSGQHGRVNIQILEAQGLQGVDKSGTSDPYVRVKIGKKNVYRTKTIPKTLAPTWHESFVYPVQAEPTQLCFKVNDYNKMGRYVRLGEYRANLWDMLAPSEGTTRLDQWLPLDPPGSGALHVVLEFAPK